MEFGRESRHWDNKLINRLAAELCIDRQKIYNWLHNRKRPRVRLGGMRGFTKEQQDRLEAEFQRD